MKTLVQKGHSNCNCKHGSGAAEGPSLQLYISFWSQIAMKRYCIMVVTAKVDRGKHPTVIQLHIFSLQKMVLRSHSGIVDVSLRCQNVSQMCAYDFFYRRAQQPEQNDRPSLLMHRLKSAKRYPLRPGLRST